MTEFKIVDNRRIPSEYLNNGLGQKVEYLSSSDADSLIEATNFDEYIFAPRNTIRELAENSK